MGKLGLLLAAAFIVAGGYTLYSSSSLDKSADVSQTERQINMLVREISESGANHLTALAADKEGLLNDDEDIYDFMRSVGFYGADGDTLEREMEGGVYKAWLDAADEVSYDVVSRGEYIFTNEHGELETIKHRTIVQGQVPKPPLEVPELPEDCDGCDGFTLNAGFIDSMAGWCSAIYLEQRVPDNTEESGYRTEIDMVFDSGHWRNGEETSFAKVLETGTLMNFILAVDKNCSSENQQGIAWDDETFNHHHYSLEFEEEGGEMEITSGTFAMIESWRGEDSKWRISFEDQNFYDEEQYLDIKKYGYGDSNWALSEALGLMTWGGDGWEYSSEAEGRLRVLENHGSQPDYSDQVFWITLEPHVPEEEGDPIAEGGSDDGGDTGQTGD